VITIYTYKGKADTAYDLPADYIPCLVGINDQGEEAYFETLCEVQPEDILQTRRSQWFDHPVLIVSVKYFRDGNVLLGYVTADQLMTTGVDF
jgi:hypothetical protein